MPQVTNIADIVAAGQKVAADAAASEARGAPASVPATPAAVNPPAAPVLSEDAAIAQSFTPKFVNTATPLGSAPPDKPSDDVTGTHEPLRKFAVQLKDNPRFVIEATDRMEAVEKYNEKCGIRSTIHKHEIERL